MEVLGDAVGRDRRSAEPALRAAGREYDYRRFCTTAWKVGNFLRNEGVRGDARVVVDPEPTPETVLSFYGTSLLGASVSFGGSTTGAKALIARASRLDGYEAGPATRRIAYGEAHDDPSVAHFERDVWSENPTMPPDIVEAEATLLAAGGRTFSHDAVLAAGRTVAEDAELEGASVAVRAPLSEPGVVVAGLVAPVVAGGTVLLPEGGATGDVAVGTPEDVPEPRCIDPGNVL